MPKIYNAPFVIFEENITMKKILLTVPFLVWSFLQAQEQKFTAEVYLVKATEAKYGKYITDKCRLEGEVLLRPDFFDPDVFVLEDYILCHDGVSPRFYYKLYDGHQTLYTTVSNATVISEKKNDDMAKVYFSKLTPTEKKEHILQVEKAVESSKQKVKLETDYEIIQEDKAVLDDGGAVLKNSVVITNFSFPGEYFVGFSVELYNNSNKRIKYASFTVAGLNAVKDRVYTLSGGLTKVIRGVGPVEPQSGASWLFETIWSDDSFHTGRIVSLSIEYFDGSKKTYTDVGKLIMPDGFDEALERLKKFNAEHSEVN
ncbi:MAG: hypothetical protein K0M63_06580 [Weeksellaceae bacterium]|nr:hypothetical protein [Weeksellaceae bacterium]